MFSEIGIFNVRTSFVKGFLFEIIFKNIFALIVYYVDEPVVNFPRNLC